MFGVFTARAIRMGELLSDRTRYAIPGFQRPYSWTIVEVSRLIDDLLFAVNARQNPSLQDRVFFLGTLVLIARPSERVEDGTQAELDTFDVVDGLQRLVTLTILYAVLRDIANADGDATLADRMDRHIRLDARSIAGSAPGSRSYCINLRQRDEAVLETYAQQPGGCLLPADPVEFEGPQREIIVNRNFIIEELRALDPAVRVQLAQFLEDCCQVVVITTDDMDNAFRIFMVVNQQGKPLSRSDVLKAELIGALPAASRAASLHMWEAAEAACGEHYEQLFSHVRTAYGNGRAPIINEIRRLAERSGGPEAFLAQKLFPAAEVLAVLLGRPVGPALLNLKAVRSVRNLARLNHSDWVPAAILYIQDHREAPDDLATFLAALDRYAYGQLLLGIGRDKRLARYGGMIDAMQQRARGTANADVLRLMTFTIEEQRNIHYNVAHDLYARSSLASKLLLLRLNDVLGDPLTPLDPAAVTVEHVLPQRLGRNSGWRTLFNDADARRYVASLGNLALVSGETNKSARNSEFAAKLSHYLLDPLMPHLAVNQGILSEAQFGPSQIERREATLLDAVRQLWPLPGATRRTSAA